MPKAAILKNNPVQLSELDTLRLLELLDNPPAPNARLLTAARSLPESYRQQMTTQRQVRSNRS
jgi:uncharacterized protein (DUF1778 family)